ncbi:hypothetical protein [Fervidibacter sacchari]
MVLSIVSVLLTLVGVWLSWRAFKSEQRARKVRFLSETLVALWIMRQSVMIALAYGYALTRQPRLHDLRGRGLEELLIARSHLDEYGKRLGLETQRALSNLSVYLDEAERAFQTGAYQEASLQLRHAAKILTEQIGLTRTVLEKVLFGGE